MIDLKGQKVLVTGATGLLGRALVDALIEKGAIVDGVAMDDLPGDWPEAANYGTYDLRDSGACEMALIGRDYVFHLAGAKGGVGIGLSRAWDFLNTNIQTATAMCRALVKSSVKRALYVSSVGAYPGFDHMGNEKSVFFEDDLWKGPPHSSDFFGGCAKRFGEVAFAAARAQYGLDYVTVRPTSCFGPYDRFDPKTGMVIAALIARIEAGERPLKVWGLPEVSRDFLFSRDAAHQMIAVMERGSAGEAYNLGSGWACTMGVLLGSLRNVYPDLKFEFDVDKPHGPMTRRMNMAKTSFLMEPGYETLPLTMALASTVEWYRSNKNYQAYSPFSV